jgi:uncharacterized membrane protein YedE/YeeE
MVLLLTGLAMGGGAGFVMHRSDFCMSGMVRDLFLFRRLGKLPALFVAILSAMLLFEAGRLLGIMRPYPFPLLGPPALTNILGGMLFGVGMVLAGGCVVGTLYKLGAGSGVSFVALVGLLAGSALYGEFHHYWAPMAARTVIKPGVITIPQALGIPPLLPLLAAVLLLSLLILRWHRQGKVVQRLYAEGGFQPWKAGVVLAAAGAVTWAVVGMPFGITTSYAKMAGFVESLLWPEHLLSLPYFRAAPLNYVNSLTGMAMKGGAAPVLDGIALAQFPVIAGIVGGSALSALLLGEFSIRFSAPPRQYLSALTGGVIMGLASRMAPACNVWHLLGGVPILAGQSLLFALGLLPGAWLGSKVLVSLVMERSSR